MTRPRFELGSLKTTNRHLTCKEMDHLSKRLDYFSPILGPVAQWIRHLTTNQGIPGSSPGRIGSFDLPKMTPDSIGESHSRQNQSAGAYWTN